MKKIIFGLLSFLLISPVLGYNVTPGFSVYNVLSLSNTQNNNSISYMWNNDIIKYKNINGILEYIPNLPYSKNNIDYGSSIDSEFFEDSYISSGISTYSGGQFNSLLSFGLYGTTPSLNYIQLYLQRINSGDFDGNNFLLSFSTDSISPFSTNYVSSSVSNSFVRLFYNNEDFTSLDVSSNPGYLEIFGNSKYVLTNKGKVFDYAGRNDISKNWVIPGLNNGYSYITFDSSNGVSFNSVMGGFNNYQNSDNFSIPTSFEFDNILLFPYFGDRQNSNKNYLVAVSNTGYVNNSAFRYLYSVYYCSPIYYTDYGSYGTWSFNESCSFVDGGEFIVGNRVYSDYSNRLYDVFRKYNKCYYTSSNGSTYNGNVSYPNNYMNIYISNSSNFIGGNINFEFYVNPSDGCVNYNVDGLYTYSVGLNSDGSTDLLSSVSNIPSPTDFGKGVSALCNVNPNLIICKDSVFNLNSGSDVSFSQDGSGKIQATVTLYDTDSSDCPDMYYTGSDGYYYHQYFDRVCYNSIVFDWSDSTPQEDLTSDLTGLENNINLAFSGIVGENFKFYSCPFNSPLKAFHLSSIGGLSSFLLDKFFDVNLVGPFNCLLGGILYSETDSVSLGSRLLNNTYHGEKYFNNFPEDVKKTINWLLFAGMVLFFWSFRPKDH